MALEYPFLVIVGNEILTDRQTQREREKRTEKKIIL